MYPSMVADNKSESKSSFFNFTHSFLSFLFLMKCLFANSKLILKEFTFHVCIALTFVGINILWFEKNYFVFLGEVIS